MLRKSPPDPQRAGDRVTPPSPIKLVPNGTVKALMAARYTSYSRLKEATNLDQAF